MKKLLALLALSLPFVSTAGSMMLPADGIGLMPYYDIARLGEVHFPVIVVNYQDIKISDTEENVLQHLNQFFNAEGYSYNGATGSVRDYFISASNGKFMPYFDILGVAQLSEERFYYGKGTADASGHKGVMAIEAARAFRDKVDFSKYDSDGDGYVDDLVVIFAGNAERYDVNDTDDEAVLPTSYKISWSLWGDEEYAYGVNAGSVWINNYTISSELAFNEYESIGTFCHEFSHGMGLPDLYNTFSTAATYTPGDYDLMDVGMYGNDRRTPPTYSALERYAMGWIDLELITEPGSYDIENVLDANQAYAIQATENEFFVIEYRHKHGWDAYLPTGGLFVWHIDYDADIWFNNQVNRTKSHQRVTLDRMGNISPALTLKSYATGDLDLEIASVQALGKKAKFTVTSHSGVQDASITHPQLHISGRSIEADEPMQVYDLMGRLMAEGKSVTIDSSGIYIVKIADRATRVLLH